MRHFLDLHAVPSFRKTIQGSPDRLRRHRTIFISDVHLGTRGCKADQLADFLAHNDCQTLYLIGDIIDGWRLKRSWFWSEAHSRVINAILKKVEDGTRVIYVPGNHDEAFRDYCGLTLAGVELKYEAAHDTANGKHFLVIHGDQFDGVVAHAPWLAHFGGWAYDIALKLNDGFNELRRLFGLPHWSLSAFLKRQVKNAASFISDFESVAAREARNRGFDGIVCGHIHHAQIKTVDGAIYCNDGDWVESCTALTEDMRGHLAIVQWRPELSPVAVRQRARPVFAPAAA